MFDGIQGARPFKSYFSMYQVLKVWMQAHSEVWKQLQSKMENTLLWLSGHWQWRGLFPNFELLTQNFWVWLLMLSELCPNFHTNKNTPFPKLFPLFFCSVLQSHFLSFGMRQKSWIIHRNYSISVFIIQLQKMHKKVLYNSEFLSEKFSWSSSESS